MAYYRDRLGFLTSLARTYGPVAAFRLGRMSVHFFSRPEAVRFFLVDRADEFTNREVIMNLRLLLGETLVSRDGLSPRRLISTCCGCVQSSAILASDGQPHHRLRQAILPGFRPEQLRRYHDAMVDLTGQTISAYQAGASIDMAREARRVSLLIAARTMLGLDLRGAERTLLDAFTYLTHKATGPLTAWDNLPVLLPISPYRRYTRAVRTVERTVRAAIEQARTAKPSDSLLARLLREPLPDGQVLTDAEIRDQLLQLFDAGHSTTSSALTWCFFLLDRHPAIRAEVLAELADVVPSGTPSFDDLARLRYLEQVVREALRLYPPIWGQARYATREFEFSGYRIPAGTFVLVSQWVTHRLPDLFENPESFEPARFALDVKHEPYSYFPFGGGHHACLGAAFAMQEAKVVLAMTLSRFNPRLLAGHLVEPEIRSMTLQPRLGLPMVLEPSVGALASRQYPVQGR